MNKGVFSSAVLWVFAASLISAAHAQAGDGSSDERQIAIERCMATWNAGRTEKTVAGKGTGIAVTAAGILGIAAGSALKAFSEAGLESSNGRFFFEVSQYMNMGKAGACLQIGGAAAAAAGAAILVTAYAKPARAETMEEHYLHNPAEFFKLPEANARGWIKSSARIRNMLDAVRGDMEASRMMCLAPAAVANRTDPKPAAACGLSGEGAAVTATAAATR